MTTNQPNQLFDLKQRKDGQWDVWTLKSPLDLGFIKREEIESLRGAAFDAEGWADYIRQPHVWQPTIWTKVKVYASRPSVDTVLDYLGVKRSRKADGSPSTNRGTRRPRPTPAPVAEAA